LAQKKYYGIKQGRETGVFDNWNECKKHIQGFSGAVVYLIKIAEKEIPITPKNKILYI